MVRETAHRRLAMVIPALVFAFFAAHVASASPASPPTLPLPTHPTLADLLSTSSLHGDGTGLLPGAGACSSARPDPITFPADDGPHDGATFEWWFWNGHLTTPDGHRWAFIVYFMSRGPLGIEGVDYTLLDVTSGKFRYGRQPLILSSPRQSTSGFVLHGAHASAFGGGGHDVVSLELDGYRLDVTFQQLKPPALLLDHGFGTYYCNSSNYYARTRMSVVGTLTGPGVDSPVRGQGWFEHNWGFLPALFAARWEYLQLQLDDGRDIFLGHMTFPLGRHDFQLDIGIISDRHGNVTTLHRSDFTITPTEHWQRDATCSYPVEFTVAVLGERFLIRPSIRDSELRASRTPAGYALWPENPVYWDGETIISGAATGRGWLDLAKYCAA